MVRNRFSFALVLLVGLVSSVNGQTPPPEKLDAIKKATVFILVDNGADAGSGSGFLVRVDEKVGYVVTNHHVVSLAHGQLRRGVPAGTEIAVVFDAGLSTERIAKAKVVAEDPEHDLAMLKIEGMSKLPKPLDAMDNPKLTETLPVLICGFPFGESLSTSKKKPNMTIGKATISSVRNDDAGNVSVVQLDGALNPGNSGGPILTADGKLVGIAVATIRGTGIGMAVPYHHLHAMMYGTVGSPSVTAIPSDGNSLIIKLDVPLIDPFSNVKTANLQFRIANDGDIRTVPLKTISLTVNPKTGWATGSFVSPREVKAGVALQIGYTCANGRMFTTAPNHFSLPKFAANATAKDAKLLTPTLETPATANSTAKAIPTLKAFEQNPERFLGNRVTVEVFLGQEGQGTELVVYSDPTTRARKLTFRAADSLAAQVRELGSQKSARLTGTMYAPETARGNHVFEVEEIAVLDDGGTVAKTLRPDGRAVAPTPEAKPEQVVAAAEPAKPQAETKPEAPSKAGKVPTVLVAGALAMGVFLVAMLFIGMRLMKHLPGKKGQAAQPIKQRPLKVVKPQVNERATPTAAGSEGDEPPPISKPRRLLQQAEREENPSTID